MSRAIVTAQRATVRGRQLVFSPVTNPEGDAIAFGRDLVLMVRNDGVAPVTVTIETPREFLGLTLADNVIDVPPGVIGMVALRPAVYARPRGETDPGKVYVNYSTMTGVSRAVVQGV